MLPIFSCNTKQTGNNEKKNLHKERNHSDVCSHGCTAREKLHSLRRRQENSHNHNQPLQTRSRSWNMGRYQRRMPTASEMNELMSLIWNKCWPPYPHYNENVGVGYELVGRNGNSILLPFTASRAGYDFMGEGHGRYWTTELAGGYNYPLHATTLIFNTTETMWSSMDRRYGNCIRPVKDY